MTMKAGVFGFAALIVMMLLGTGLAQNPQIPAAQGEAGYLELITEPQLAEPTASSLGGDLREARPPLGIPVSDDEFNDMKRGAVANPDPAVMAQWADDIEEFSGPEPLHTINNSFVGLDRFTAQSGGFIFYPPDTTVSASSTKVVEATNSALRLFTTPGGVIATMNLNAFFSASSGTYGFLFDPKVFYDRLSENQRFWVVALSRNPSTKVSRIWLAVSRSTSPTSLAATQWCRYFIDARRNAGTVKDSWADYPGIGFGADAFVVSVNNFQWVGTFTYAIVRALRKPPLEANAAGCPSGTVAAMKTFQPITFLNNSIAFTLQPVQHYTAPSDFSGVIRPVYLMATEFGSSNTIRVWRIANVGGTATLAGPVALSGLSFGVPPNSPQFGTSTLLATGDDRITQAAGAGNVLHGVFATTCNIGGGAVEACVRYIRIRVGGPTLSGVFEQQLTFGGTNTFYWWPGVAVDLIGRVLVVYQRGSASTYLSAGYTGKTASSTIFEANNVLVSGSCARTTFPTGGGPQRTGDYVGAQMDPGGGSFWLAAERATGVSGLTGCQWQTWIRKVTGP